MRRELNSPATVTLPAFGERPNGEAPRHRTRGTSLNVNFGNIDTVVRELRHRETWFRTETMDENAVKGLVEETLADVRAATRSSD